jgi:hypothetical protein
MLKPLATLKFAQKILSVIFFGLYAEDAWAETELLMDTRFNAGFAAVGGPFPPYAGAKAIPDGIETGKFWHFNEGRHANYTDQFGNYVSFLHEHRLVVSHVMEENSASALRFSNYNNYGLAANDPGRNKKLVHRVNSNRQGALGLYINTANEIRNVATDYGSKWKDDSWPHFLVVQNMKNRLPLKDASKVQVSFNVQVPTAKKLPTWTTKQDLAVFAYVLLRGRGTNHVLWLGTCVYSPSNSYFFPFYGPDQYGSAVYRRPADGWKNYPALGEKRLAQFDVLQLFREAAPKFTTISKNPDDWDLVHLNFGYEMIGHWESDLVYSDVSVKATMKSPGVSPSPTPTNTPPSVSLTSPASNATFTAPANITLSANASDSNGTVNKVDFYRGGTTLIGTDTTSPYSWAWNNVAAGSYSLTAKATDNAGAVTTSGAVAITVKAPTLAPTPAGSGTGLTGQYFDNSNFTGTIMTRTDATVNFNWGLGSPASSIAVDTFSARWIGKVQAQHSQTYTFHVTGDDGVRLWVNGKLLIDKWVLQSATEWSGSIALVAGNKYDIKLEYYENQSAAVAQLRWSSASTPKAIIPSSQLYPTGIVPQPSGSQAFKASADFSSSQGHRGWSYLDSSGTRMVYDPAALRWVGEAYCWIWASGVHPNNRDAIRRWTVPQSGTISITGNVHDLDGGGGDGVRAIIRKNGVELWRATIANGNGVGVNFSIPTTVTAGNTIDFVINRIGDSRWDSTAFDPTIVLSPATPTGSG